MTIIEECGISHNHEYQILVLTHTGARNGYVGVKETSPLYGMNYNSLSDMFYKHEIYIHGGLTYSGQLNNIYIIGSLENYWYFGFDCSHYEDGRIPFDEMVKIIDTSEHLEDYKAKAIQQYKSMENYYLSDSYMAKSKEFVYKHCIMLSDFLNDIETGEVKIEYDVSELYE